MHTDANTRLVGPGSISLKYDPRYGGIRMEIHHVSIHLQADEVMGLITTLHTMGSQNFPAPWGLEVINLLRKVHPDG